MVDEINAKDMRLIDASMMSRDELLVNYGDQIKLDASLTKLLIEIGETIPGRDVADTSSLTLNELIACYESKPRTTANWDAKLYAHTNHVIYGDLLGGTLINPDTLVRDALFKAGSQFNFLVRASVGRLGEPRFIAPSWLEMLHVSLDVKKISWNAITFDDAEFLDLDTLPAPLVARLNKGTVILPWHKVPSVAQDMKLVLENIELLYEEEEYLTERIQQSIKTMREHAPAVPFSPLGSVTSSQNRSAKRKPGAPPKEGIVQRLYEQRRARGIPLTTLIAEKKGIAEDYHKIYGKNSSTYIRTIKLATIDKHLKAIGFYDFDTKSFVTKNKTP